MLFNSIEYVIFLPVVVILFFLLPHRFRWILLLIASYYFYASWKFEYAFLLALSTLIDYTAGLLMENKPKEKRKKYLLVSLSANLIILFGFKYFNFVNDSLRELFNSFNIFYNVPAFNVLLPVGISFYTFQSMSYAIDVYRGTKKAEHHFGIFALYVSFFPQLVAGPIERSTRLLPQFYKKMEFDWERVKSGLWLILWGLFQKVVIADRLAVYANQVYEDPGKYNAAQIVLAIYLFGFQLLCDFSGYSDIAVGSARLMGYNLMENFKFPTAARNLRQFWDRWHISLTTWIKDYLYVPMASRFRERWQRPFVALCVFTIMGIWHGAAWNFIFFGLFAGFTFIIGYSTRKIRERIYKKYLPFHSLIFRKFWNFGVVIFTFQFMILFSFFFRCPNITIMKQMITLPFIKGDFSLLNLPLKNFSWYEIVISILGITILEVVSWFRYTKQVGNKFSQYPIVFRWTLAYLLILAVLLLGEYRLEPFIYFQF